MRRMLLNLFYEMEDPFLAVRKILYILSRRIIIIILKRTHNRLKNIVILRHKLRHTEKKKNKV